MDFSFRAHDAFTKGRMIGAMRLRHLIHPSVEWLDEPSARRVVVVAGVVVAGMALYGFSVGYWRSPLMGWYVAVKMPLLIGLTLAFNALLNGLLAMLLGSGLGLRQSFLALLTSFAIMALILGSLAPVTWLMAWNAPPPDSPDARVAHNVYLLAHTFLIAFAGITGNVHLHRLLRAKAPGGGAATATLLAWLGGNCFLGAQFSYIFRPFFGSPSLGVEFLRPDPMNGSFHEAVWRMLDHVTGGLALPVLLGSLVIFLIPVVRSIRPAPTPKANSTNHPNPPP
jgi:hypothetical protein